MASRDLSKAEKAAAEIRRSTGNGNIVVQHLNLSSLLSVRELVHEHTASDWIYLLTMLVGTVDLIIVK